MKKLVIMLGALALMLALITVPVAAATWSNGNWITDDKTNEYYGTADPVYDEQTGVTSKYNPIINTDPDRSTYGWVQFMLKAGGLGASSAGSQIVYVRNLKDHHVQPFNSTYYPDGTVLEDTNPGWLQVRILADGLSDIKDGLLPAGRFEACIADGNNGQPECQEFDIGNAQTTRVPFFGHAASLSTGDAVCEPVISIKEASYCAESEPAVTHQEYRYVITPAVPPTPESYTYVGHDHGDCDWHNGESAYYEIVAFGSYDGKCKIVLGWEPYDFAIGMVHYKINSSGPLKYRYHAATPGHYEYVGHHHGDYSYTQANPGHDAVWSSWSVNLPPAGSVSEEKTVIDVPAKQGGCASGVKESLQSAVSQGYSSVKFDNTKNPGGIFNPAGDLLLSPITDPAYGIVKTVTITYNRGCGSADRTVTGMEGTVITLS